MRLLGEVSDLPLRRHGGDAGEGTLDLSANVNPYGPSDAMIAAIRAAALAPYPDPTARPARRALAAHLGCGEDAIVVGSGASELFWSFAHALLDRRSTVLLVEPAFAELGAAATARGARVVAWRARPPTFDVDPDAVAALAQDLRPDVIALATPTSPVGRVVSSDAIRAIARAAPEACVLLDESFLALSDAHRDAAVALPANVVRVRSLTKDHAIAGVRVGYLVGPPSLARVLEASRPPWTVSAPAQAAAIASIADAPFVAACRERLRADRAHLVRELTSRAYRPVPSVAPYVIVPVARGAEARARFLRHGVVVRDCASFGLPAFVRVAVRPRAETSRLCAALDAEGDLRC